MQQWTSWKAVFSVQPMLMAVHTTMDTTTKEWCFPWSPCLDVINGQLVSAVQLSEVK
jgi:hypothetical protein